MATRTVDEAIRSLLSTPRTWAVVGCSPDPSRDSHQIARLLRDRGHRVIPVNPAADEILGERCYPNLRDVPEAIDVVDIFRRSDHAGAHVDEAIEIGARAVWMQLGVIDEAAAERARAAGLDVVMDRCPRLELPRLEREPEQGGGAPAPAPRPLAEGEAASHPRPPGATSDWRRQILEVKDPPEKVPRIYSRLAPVYEVWARLTESRARRRVLELAAVRDGESVLEVATGTGVQLVALARANPSGRVTGVELADGMLAQTRRRLAREDLQGVEVRKADARRLPFPDESFDLVTNGYMLDLLPRAEIPRVLSEFRRILRPGGRVVLSNMTRGERPAHRVWDALYSRGIVLTANCRGVLAAPVLGEVGFVDVQREYVAQMLFPTEVVRAVKPG